MGRRAVAPHLKRKSLAFALSESELTFLDVWAEEHHLDSRSAALRDVLREMEEQSDGDTRRKLAELRAELGRRSRLQAVPKPSTAKCPNCGDADLFVKLRDDHWRCDACQARG